MRAVGILMVCSMAMLPQRVAAQLVVGTVSSGPAVLSGALVEVRSAQDSVLSRVSTRPDGTFQVMVPEGMSITLRVVAIGYRPARSVLLSVAAGGRETVALRLEPAAVSLDPILVRGERGTCRGAVLDQATLSRLVEQLDLATTVMQAGFTRRGLTFRTEWVIREALRADGDSAVWADTTQGVLAAWPAESALHHELREHGFARALTGGEGEGMIFHGPDLSVIWSEWFLSSYCFGADPSAVSADADETLRVRFEPAGRPRRAEIEGTLEFSRADLTLRRITFQHVGLPSRFPRGSSGGEIEFASAAGGLWYPSSWRLWAPLELEMAPQRPSILRPGAAGPRRPLLGEVKVVGRAERIGRVVAVEER